MPGSDTSSAIPAPPAVPAGASTEDLVVLDATFAELSAATLYEILRLRVDVFVVEQDCVFGDVDGRDREPGCRHLWIERDGEVVGYARILSPPAADPGAMTEIGRVVTRADVRDQRLGVRLMREAMARVDGPIVLKAQARLAGWYGQFGFVVEGPEFMWDGMAHVKMTIPGDR